MKGNLQIDLPSYQKLGVVESLPSSIVVYIDGRTRRLDSILFKATPSCFGIPPPRRLNKRCMITPIVLWSHQAYQLHTPPASHCHYTSHSMFHSSPSTCHRGVICLLPIPPIHAYTSLFDFPSLSPLPRHRALKLFN